MRDKLTAEQEQLLIATRCFGRGTPFPHRLMQLIMAELTDTPYKKLIGDLLQQKLIQRESKQAFSLTSQGLQVRSNYVMPAPIWDAVLKIMKLAIARMIDVRETESVEYMCIHTVALGNIFKSRLAPIYMEMIGLTIICHEFLGEDDEAEQYKQRLQNALNKWHSEIQSDG